MCRMMTPSMPCRFAVVPLSEDCGFIEWVPQTVTLRTVCQETYAAEGLYDSKITLPTMKKILDTFTVSLSSPGSCPLDMTLVLGSGASLLSLPARQAHYTVHLPAMSGWLCRCSNCR